MDEPGAATVKDARSDAFTEVHFFFGKRGQRGLNLSPGGSKVKRSSPGAWDIVVIVTIFKSPCGTET